MARRRMRVEPLEERRMLATFTVSNLLDGSVTAAGQLPGSLRQAIFDANATAAADEIDFSVSGTLTLTAGEIRITNTLTIMGPGETLLMIDASGNDPTPNVNIDDVILLGTPTGANDFGDAPSPYPTTLADNGARHIAAGPRLGANRDAEADGQPSVDADGDDVNGGPDDEDGVAFDSSTIIASMFSTTFGSLQVDLQDADLTSNLLDAWIDFNRDGDWDDIGEQIFANVNLGITSGIQNLFFTIPQDTGSNVEEGITYARFRLSTAGNLSPSGAASDGEVEDYQVTIGASLGPGSIQGQKWNDLNGDGIKDLLEPGLEGWTIFLDENGNGVLDTESQTIASANVPLDILDNTSTLSQIEVSGVSTISDLNLTLEITHTYDSDLEAYLTSPLGTQIRLFLFVGESGDNFQHTTLDDEAATSISVGLAPFSGSYQPEELLSAFDGEDPNGFWILEIIDQATPDEGTLNSWSLTIETPTETATTADSSGYYAFLGLSPGMYTVREVNQTGWTQSYPFAAEGYLGTAVPYNFEDISATGQLGLTDVDDDFFELTSLDLAGFQFDFYGTTYDSLFASSNGLITFGAGIANFSNTDFTLTPTVAAIAPFWDDLILNTSTSPNASVLWEVQGSGSDQRLILQWNEVEYFGDEGLGLVTFQAVLNESDSSIQFNYFNLSSGSSQSEGSQATVGVKGNGQQGGDRLLLSFNAGPNEFVGTGQSVLLNTGTLAGSHAVFVSPDQGILDIDFGNVEDTPEPSADYDGDGDVDGRDFLMWQRGASPNPLSSDDLGLWQEQYGEEGGLSAVGSLLSAEEDWVPAFAGMTVVGRGNDVSENQYVEEVDRVFEQLNTSQTLLGKPAVAPAPGFGEMVARRGVARRFAVEPFEKAL